MKLFAEQKLAVIRVQAGKCLNIVAKFNSSNYFSFLRDILKGWEDTNIQGVRLVKVNFYVHRIPLFKPRVSVLYLSNGCTIIRPVTYSSHTCEQVQINSQTAFFSRYLASYFEGIS